MLCTESIYSIIYKFKCNFRRRVGECINTVLYWIVEPVYKIYFGVTDIICRYHRIVQISNQMYSAIHIISFHLLQLMFYMSTLLAQIETYTALDNEKKDYSKLIVYMQVFND